MNRYASIILILAGAVISAASCSEHTSDDIAPIHVEVQQDESGWTLLRNGQPYSIKGVGGSYDLERLAALGANSVRTWNSDDVGPILDKAHALGMTVTVGLWLEHERHGFSYSDEDQVSEQLEKVRAAVLRYKDHPALLMWGVGNEMEEYGDGDDKRVWKAVNDVAAMIKELDPHHPTMTVTAEIGGGRIKMVHEYATEVDIHGINAYGGAASIADRMRKGGATKPYVITEFGPAGPWETPKTEWGAPLEQTSTQKADAYRLTYQQSILENPGMALGGYAFLWGYKMEGTETWFGMLLSDGAKLGAVDIMSEFWSGDKPADRSPNISPIVLQGEAVVDPGTELQATIDTIDPEGEPLSVRWVLRRESGDYETGGDFRPPMPDIDNALLSVDDSSATFRMPDKPGEYRLFVYARDPGGNAATANIPILVKGEAGTRFPVSIYEDRFAEMPWRPTMSASLESVLEIDDQWSDSMYEGANALRLHYSGVSEAVSLRWDAAEDHQTTIADAGSLILWARGALGGEQIRIETGTDGGEGKSVTLSDQWQSFTVPLNGSEIRAVDPAFAVTLLAGDGPVTVYLDSVRFVE